MTGNATDRAARAELWLSFRSLVQAYLAAATVGSDIPQALVAELPGGMLQIVGAAHTVHLEMEPETGEGYWAVFAASAAAATSSEPLDEGQLRLHLDAQIEWSGKAGRLEMDQVAEALAMMVIS